jgi:molybdopterin-guanine dinucleotide biosynthesis protein MobB
MKTVVIAVVGGKKSGKTTTIERATKELVSRGHSVCAVKHVSEPDFTIDSKGKDSWRFAQAGAKTIITVAANEIATIEKGNTENLSLENVLQKCRGSDIIFIEGFKNLVKADDVQKIVIVGSVEEAFAAKKKLKPILAFAGSRSMKNLANIPCVNVLKNPKRIADIVENLLRQ